MRALRSSICLSAKCENLSLRSRTRCADCDICFCPRNCYASDGCRMVLCSLAIVSLLECPIWQPSTSCFVLCRETAAMYFNSFLFVLSPICRQDLPVLQGRRRRHHGAAAGWCACCFGVICFVLSGVLDDVIMARLRDGAFVCLLCLV